MANAKLNAILEKIKQEKEKKKASGGQNNSKFNMLYPFWQIEEGPENKAIVRLLPHKGMDDESLSPFVDRMEHTLSINGEDQKIPCLSMYNEPCPICALSQKYYKSEGKNSQKGKYFWRSVKSLAAALIVKDTLPADESTGETCEGKVKVLQLSSKLAKSYNESWKMMITDGEIEDLPWDFQRGLNFYLVKTPNGQYPSYDNSKFANKPSTLGDDFIASYDPIDLRTLLPENPGADKVQRMLDSHLTGEDYSDSDSDSDSDDSAEETTTKAKLKKRLAEAKLQKESARSDTDEDEVETKPAAVVEDGDDDEDDEEDYLAKLKRRAKAK